MNGEAFSTVEMFFRFRSEYEGGVMIYITKRPLHATALQSLHLQLSHCRITLPYHTRRNALHLYTRPILHLNCRIGKITLDICGHRNGRCMNGLTIPALSIAVLTHCRIVELSNYPTRRNALHLYTRPILHLNCRIGKLITWDICAERNGRCIQRPYNPCIYNCLIAELPNYPTIPDATHCVSTPALSST
jgi:hypothetical protein